MKSIILFTAILLFIDPLIPVVVAAQENVVVPEISVLEDEWGGAPPSNIRAICLSVARELSEFFPQRMHKLTRVNDR